MINSKILTNRAEYPNLQYIRMLGSLLIIHFVKGILSIRK